jgi:hypothetical protein
VQWTGHQLTRLLHEKEERFPLPAMSLNDVALTLIVLWLTITLLLAALVAWDTLSKRHS